ncbi:chain-length determining protein [Vibrio crassostreae 9CS106]|nr:chain-length determining protein [Vibrio crassostreae 9CS106]
MKQQRQPQPYSPQNPPRYTNNDEIDLRELIKELWNGKLTVLLSTVLLMIVSLGFVLIAQEWWSSKAKIIKVQPQDMVAYQLQVKQFQPVFDVYQEDGTVLVSDELHSLTDSKTLFQYFVDTFNSTSNKRIFLDSNPDFLSFKDTILTGKGDTEEDSRKLYEEWFARISAIDAEKNSRNSPYLLSFQTTTKESSFDLLSLYISITERKVREEAFNNLQALVSVKRSELVQQKKILESQANNQLLVEVERTKYAVDIAKAAGVKQPIQMSNGSKLFGIELGEKGLEAKVKALESVNNLSVIEPRLQQINAKLDMLKNLEIDRTVEFQTFRFLENVEQPITRDKPKRALIVALGTLLGGMLGVAIVLIRFAFRKED